MCFIMKSGFVQDMLLSYVKTEPNLKQDTPVTTILFIPSISKQFGFYFKMTSTFKQKKTVFMKFESVIVSPN
jgi:hypothetical protein